MPKRSSLSPYYKDSNSGSPGVRLTRKSILFGTRELKGNSSTQAVDSKKSHAASRP